MYTNINIFHLHIAYLQCGYDFLQLAVNVFGRQGGSGFVW